MKIHSILQLSSVDSVAKAQALNALGIYTIRDMAEYDGCRHAEYLMAFFTQGITECRIPLVLAISSAEDGQSQAA